MGVETSQLEKITAVAKSYGVTRLILFGSAATTPETARDIDLACDGITGWDLYALGAQLEEAIDLPIDLIPLSPINSFTKAIEAQGIPLL